ncbi:hypothetical protein DUNSADRAFT_15167 [Dunaliella salina]|uniref:Rubisco LSMT substrate-binding domain-containing protein n=1 Tax=Dunaliella salina TaxID=3046 RepID=A0ABQ7G615_DUNSA|nr:hypothetical protein DUNSADRAFT_15167 [Dunaliella salina]|eukprot:KAF5830023.1 hypothetical protein DUNSADRAFT_15167 [Dunaliella salina]
MKIPEFDEWCEKHGVQRGCCEAAYVSDGWRGILAISPLNPGDVLLQVPERLLISRASAERDHVLGPLLHLHQMLNSYQVLGVHLLHEVSKAEAGGKGSSSSWWRPYLQQLPRSYTTLCCFSGSDIVGLQVPYAVDKARTAVDKARQQWKESDPLLKHLGLPKKYCGLGAWLWASSTLLSRTMYVPWDEAGCLMPYGDLHNYQAPPGPHITDILEEDTAQDTIDMPDQACAHAAHDRRCSSTCGNRSGSGSSGCTVSGTTLEADGARDRSQEGEEQLCGDGSFDASCGMYKLYARRPYAKGEQVYLCYGRHSNLELLELYGFMLDDNPHEEALLSKGALEAAMVGGTSALAAALPNTQHQPTCVNTTSSTGKERGRQVHAIPSNAAGSSGAFGSRPSSSVASGTGPSSSIASSNSLSSSETSGITPPSICSDDAPTLPQLAPCDCFLHINGAPSWSLLQALRTAAATPHQRKTCAHKLAANERISREGDLRVLGWLLDACLLQLSSLPTSISEDQEVLDELRSEQKHEQGPTCMELSIQWRLCYKRILMQGVQRALHGLKVLQQKC